MSEAGNAPAAALVPPSRARLLLVLFAGLLAISTAAPLLVAAAMPAPAMTFWRCAISGSIMLCVAFLRERAALRAISRRDLALIALSGALLAAHFLLWIEALSRTSVISATVLVTTNPIWVALGAWVFLRERSSRATWIAIAVGIAGAVLLGLADLGAGAGGGRPDSLFGNLLAIAGALAGSSALLGARALRARVPFATFVALLAIAAAIVGGAYGVATGAEMMPPTRAQALCVLGVALGPHLVGNTALNWALGWLPAPRVALVILGEPIGATLLAWAFLEGQTPAPLAVVGGMLVLGAVVIAARQPMRPRG